MIERRREPWISVAEGPRVLLRIPQAGLSLVDSPLLIGFPPGIMRRLPGHLVGPCQQGEGSQQ